MAISPNTLQRFQHVARLATPVMATNLLLTVVNVLDVFMVGRLGPIEIAAVGMANTVRMLVNVSTLMVTSGAMALVAQARGAQDDQRMRFLVRQTLVLMVFLTAILSVAGVLGAEPILTFLNSGGEPRAVTIGTNYLVILFWGTLFLTGNFAISSLMQGAGDTVTPFYLSLLINFVNIGLNALLIFGLGPIPALGASGAALGTVAARALGFGVGIALFYSGRNVIHLKRGSSYKPHWRTFWDILSIGIPSGLQGIVRNSASLVMIRIITMTSAGTYGASAFAIGMQLESLVFMPGLGVSIAATALVGQSLGAWHLDDAKADGNAAILFAIALMSVLAVPLIIFAKQIILLFEPSAHPLVVEAGVSYLRINSLFQPILAIAIVTNGALRGAGDNRPGLMGNLWGRWLVMLPLAYVLALPLGFGVTGVWWAMGMGMAIAGGYVLIRWRSGKWTDVALRQSPLYKRHLHALPIHEQQRYVDMVRTPLMIRPGTSEKVYDSGVKYTGEQGHVWVEFQPSHFTLHTHTNPEPTT